MNNAPDRVSYLALLTVIRDRTAVNRNLPDQRYFIELAQELVRLYWQHDGGRSDDRRQAA